MTLLPFCPKYCIVFTLHIIYIRTSRVQYIQNVHRSRKMFFIRLKRLAERILFWALDAKKANCTSVHKTKMVMWYLYIELHWYALEIPSFLR